ncbi:hypothetical protein U9M48_032842 [Paspalum notatum var. saurae]|uniref:Uncharacterized protein n=1 Tax=Paspalum notatum var. saurae TaxID=547442 RepID=A0AAQ3X659_PASNO
MLALSSSAAFNRHGVGPPRRQTGGSRVGGAGPPHPRRPRWRVPRPRSGLLRLRLCPTSSLSAATRRPSLRPAGTRIWPSDGPDPTSPAAPASAASFPAPAWPLLGYAPPLAPAAPPPLLRRHVAPSSTAGHTPLPPPLPP